MIDLLVERWGFSEVHAYFLCSVAMNLRLSQVVNEPMFTVSAAHAQAHPSGEEDLLSTAITTHPVGRLLMNSLMRLSIAAAALRNRFSTGFASK